MMSLIIPDINLVRKVGTNKHRVSEGDARERTNYASTIDKMTII